MLHSEILARSLRPLTDVLIDRVRRWTGSIFDQRSDDDRLAPSPQLSFLFDEGDSKTEPTRSAMPSEFAGAILLGGAFEQCRDDLAALQESGRVTLIETASPDLACAVAGILELHVIGKDHVMSKSDLRAGRVLPVKSGTVLLLSERRDDSNRAPTDAEVSQAIQRGSAIVAVSANNAKNVPASIGKIADAHITLPSLDASAVTNIINAVTGQTCEGLSDELCSRLTLAFLDLSIQSSFSSKTCVNRIRRLAPSTSLADDDVPPLSQMHGLGPFKQWGLQIAEDLQAYTSGQLSWHEVPPGCLLVSKPGCGKTTAAASLAREAKVSFLPCSYGAWQAGDRHLGVVIGEIRSTFAKAKAMRPCILFIDEIDSIPRRTDDSRRHSDFWNAIVNALLEEMDAGKHEGVFVLAACNSERVDILDPALIRAGRLDRRFEITPPDVDGLIGIFRYHLKSDLSTDDLRPLAVRLRGRTGADVARIVRDARMLARTRKICLSLGLLAEIIHQETPQLPAPYKKRIGYHEAGHAVAAAALNVARPVALSIDGGGGWADMAPGELRAMTRPDLEDYLVVLLAGRAAEEIVFGGLPTAGSGGGPQSDIAKSSWLAARIETMYGLGATGLSWLPVDGPEDLLHLSALQPAIRKTLGAAYERAKAIIADHRHIVNTVAEALIDRGYLAAAEIEGLLAGTLPENASHPANVAPVSGSPTAIAGGIGAASSQPI